MGISEMIKREENYIKRLKKGGEDTGHRENILRRLKDELTVECI